VATSWDEAEQKTAGKSATVVAIREQKNPYRLTSKNKVAVSKVEKVPTDRVNAALAEATNEYAVAKISGIKISAPKLAAKINAKYSEQGLAEKNFIHERRIRDNQNRPGLPAKHMGPVCSVPDELVHAAALQCMADQIAGKETKMKGVRQAIQKSAKANGLDFPGPQAIGDQLRRLHPELNPESCKNVEGTRWEWQDKALYNEWFDGWKKFLIENGYAYDQPEYDLTGKMISEVTFYKDKLCRIINLDETQIPRDGASRSTNHVSNRVMICKHLPRPGKKTSKSSGHETFILIVNALGEVGLPFIIFDTSAEKVENRKVRPEHITGLPDVLCQFGHDEPIRCSAEFAVTDKGSMDKTLWPQFVRQTIWKLFPDMQAEYKATGRVVHNRVCLKVDGAAMYLNSFDHKIYADSPA
jgi:hypothetical protein